ncbi:hypothetical protein B0T20DRAFT_417700 [Sordaria brevicollis]|uniref:Uncharacterized protein n=1 Tax=Sordaria brevicollis TaxID=83679 RepID=A0AAE0PAI3_SORBR|nr:hypothetical protein B0T20DRAFT_417700 [Sordaria brevicollis]
MGWIIFHSTCHLFPCAFSIPYPTIYPQKAISFPWYSPRSYMQARNNNRKMPMLMLTSAESLVHTYPILSSLQQRTRKRIRIRKRKLSECVLSDCVWYHEFALIPKCEVPMLPVLIPKNVLLV